MRRPRVIVALRGIFFCSLTKNIGDKGYDGAGFHAHHFSDGRRRVLASRGAKRR